MKCYVDQNSHCIFNGDHNFQEGFNPLEGMSEVSDLEYQDLSAQIRATFNESKENALAEKSEAKNILVAKLSEATGLSEEDVRKGL